MLWEESFQDGGMEGGRCGKGREWSESNEAQLLGQSWCRVDPLWSLTHGGRDRTNVPQGGCCPDC